MNQRLRERSVTYPALVLWMMASAILTTIVLHWATATPVAAAQEWSYVAPFQIYEFPGACVYVSGQAIAAVPRESGLGCGQTHSRTDYRR